MNWKALLLIVVVTFGAYQHFKKPKTHIDFQQLSTQVTEATLNEGKPFSLKEYVITPLQPFEMDAKILSARQYSSDAEAELSPVDLALGWGPMSDSGVISQIEVSQGDRWYHWRTDHFPIPRREIETHSANMHMIPSSAAIENTLTHLEKGQHIAFKGYLIQANRQDGYVWRSSLSREDTGAGACEVVYLTSLTVLP
jgi:hypothetical protein